MHTYETRKKIGLSLKSIIRTNNTLKTIKLDTRLNLSLRSKGVKVKVFGKSKKLVKEFPTITSTALHFNINRRMIGRYTDTNKSYSGYTFITNFKDNIQGD